MLNVNLLLLGKRTGSQRQTILTPIELHGAGLRAQVVPVVCFWQFHQKHAHQEPTGRHSVGLLLFPFPQRSMYWSCCWDVAPLQPCPALPASHPSSLDCATRHIKPSVQPDWAAGGHTKHQTWEESVWKDNNHLFVSTWNHFVGRLHLLSLWFASKLIHNSQMERLRNMKKLGM